jgi:hypothetical protein
MILNPNPGLLFNTLSSSSGTPVLNTPQLPSVNLLSTTQTPTLFPTSLQGTPSPDVSTADPLTTIQTLLQSILMTLQNLGNGGANTPTPPKGEEATEIKNMGANFDKIDTNKDGFLTDDEIKNSKQDYKSILAHSSALMFTSIDPGDPAWHGLSKADVTGIQGRLNNGETLAGISTSLSSQVSAQRDIGPGAQAFQQYVDQERKLFPLDKKA